MQIFTHIFPYILPKIVLTYDSKVLDPQTLLTKLVQLSVYISILTKENPAAHTPLQLQLVTSEKKQFLSTTNEGVDQHDTLVLTLKIPKTVSITHR